MLALSSLGIPLQTQGKRACDTQRRKRGAENNLFPLCLAAPYFQSFMRLMYVCQKVKVIAIPGKTITYPLDFISLKGRCHLHFKSPKVQLFQHSEETLTLNKRSWSNTDLLVVVATVWQATILHGHCY